MKAIHLIGLAALCVLAAGLVSAGSTDDREARELARRLDRLERAHAETQQALSGLSRAVSELEKSLRSGRTGGDLRAVTSQADKQDTRIADIEKSLADVNRAVIQLQKQLGPRGDLLTALDRRIDERTTRIARWLDEYHPRKTGASHREEIERLR
jgi:septal ring factor EnvC (AmiA/AmiB activator)